MSRTAQAIAAGTHRPLPSTAFADPPTFAKPLRAALIRGSCLHLERSVFSAEVFAALAGDAGQGCVTSSRKASGEVGRRDKAGVLMRPANASANYYRDALHGDGLPRWTKVWSHIELDKIFDTTAQRDRAMNEYQLALQREDNTLDALSEAKQFLQKPYEWPD